MSLQKEIENALSVSRTSGDGTLSAYQVIVGEFQRQPVKELSDDASIGILKRMEGYEVERLAHAKEENSSYLEVLRSWIPAQLDRDAIKSWITDNVDFSALKNKMQAISLVTKAHPGLVDGQLAKEIVIELAG